MLDKEILGLISAVMATVSNAAYLVSTLRGKSRPHVFSWTIWGLLTAITYFAQRSADAGPGAWHMAVNSVTCFIVAGFAIARGSHNITRSDVISFVCALSAIPLWYITHDPLAAVLTVIGVEAFAFYPTFRKSYARPHEELAFTYGNDGLRCLISLLAMDSYSLTTVLYPAFIAVTDGVLVSMLLVRRHKIRGSDGGNSGRP